MPITRVRICGCSHEEGRHELRSDGRHSGPCLHGCGCTRFHSRRRGSGTRLVSPMFDLAELRSPIDQAFHAVQIAKAAIAEAEGALREAVKLAKLAKSSTYGLVAPPAASPAADSASPPRPPRPPRSTSPAPAPSSGRLALIEKGKVGEELGRGAERVLFAVAQHVKTGGVTREQLAVLTGYKKSTRNTYIKQLRRAELVEDKDERIVVTTKGAAALPSGWEPLPEGEELVSHWRRELPAGKLVVLDCLLTAHPARVSIQQIEVSTGYTKSTRNTYLKKLRARELVERHRDGTVSISESFATTAKLGAARKVG